MPSSLAISYFMLSRAARASGTLARLALLELEPLEVYAIKSRVLKDGYYKKSQNGTGMYLYGMSVQQEQVGLNAEHWKELAAEIMLALEQLGIRE